MRKGDKKLNVSNGEELHALVWQKPLTRPGSRHHGQRPQEDVQQDENPAAAAGLLEHAARSPREVFRAGEPQSSWERQLIPQMPSLANCIKLLVLLSDRTGCGLKNKSERKTNR